MVLLTLNFILLLAWLKAAGFIILIAVLYPVVAILIVVAGEVSAGSLAGAAGASGAALAVGGAATGIFSINYVQLFEIVAQRVSANFTRKSLKITRESQKIAADFSAKFSEIVKYFNNSETVARLRSAIERIEFEIQKRENSENPDEWRWSTPEVECVYQMRNRSLGNALTRRHLKIANRLVPDEDSWSRMSERSKSRLESIFPWRLIRIALDFLLQIHGRHQV